VLAVLLDAEDVDGVLLSGYFGGYSTQAGGVEQLELAAAREMATLVPERGKPVVVHTMFPLSPSSEALRAAGIPVHRHLESATRVLSGVVALSLPAFEEELPAAAVPVADASYDGAKGLFAEAGLDFPASRTVHRREDLPDALAVTGFPVVLKALGQVHKSDAGGVVLGLADEHAAVAAYDDLVARLAPPAVSVEAMADLGNGVEVIAGCVRDRTFGPVLMVGIGGVLTEVLADTVCALAPVDPDRARAMLLGLRGAPLLHGVRGRSPVDLDALAVAVSAVSRVAAEHPELAELEVNPLLATPSGAVALDARVVPGQSPLTSRR
jgi:acetate---CoA ligase (ADP-forming)